MPLMPIVKAGDPVLRQKTQPIEKIDDALLQLISDMFVTMYAAPGIGLAAIQIGVPQRIITIDLAKKDEPPEKRVFINPQITWSSDETSTYDEGCLSIPEVYEEVERPEKVKVKYLDLDGQEHEIEADGLLATCLQHEIDHIEGKLFIDHISRVKRDMIVKKFKKAAKRGDPIKPAAADDVPEHHLG